MNKNYKLGFFYIFLGIITFVYFQNKIRGWCWLEDWEILYIRLSWIGILSEVLGIVYLITGLLTKKNGGEIIEDITSQDELNNKLEEIIAGLEIILEKLEALR